MRRLLAHRGLLLALAVGFALNLLAANHSNPLWDQDEAAYAGFAHTMVATGDWAIPSFTWSDIHRKPPLHIWMMAGSFTALGETLFAVRFHSAVAIGLTCALLVIWGSAIFGRDRALGGAVILASSLFGVFGKVAVADGLLVLFETAAALALLRFMAAPGWRWALTFWGAVALGLLTKGPPVLILAVGLAGWLALFHPRRRFLVGLHPWFGLPLAAAPLMAWGWWTWQLDGGETVHWMLDWYVLKRAGGAVLGQSGPPGYYLASFALLLFPWFGLLPAALLRVVRRMRTGDSTYHALAGWLIAGWLVYELLPSKLPAYSLGAFPALAVILADQALDLSTRRLARSRTLRWGLTFNAVFAFVLGASLFSGTWWLLPGEVLPGLAFAGAAAAFAGVSLAVLSRRGAVTAGLICAIAGSMLFFLLAWTTAIPSLAPRLAVTRLVADQIEDLAAPDATVVFARNFRLPSLPLYVAQSGFGYRELGDGSARDLLAGTAPVVLVTDGESDWAGLQGGVRRVAGWVPDKGVPIRFWVVANGPALATQSQHEEPIGVLTFNVLCRRCDREGYDPWDERLPHLRAVLERCQPNLVGLQEPVGKRDLEDLLGQDSTYEVVSYQSGPFTYADAAILVHRGRFDVLQSGQLWLSKTPGRPFAPAWKPIAVPRYACWVHLRQRSDGQHLLFVNTHFDSNGPNKDGAARLFGEVFGPIAEAMPVIATGDFNTRTSEERWDVIVGGLVAAHDRAQETEVRGPSPVDVPHSSDYVDPNRRVDHILLSDDIDVLRWVLDAETYGDPPRRPSDHPAIYADVSL